MGYYISEFSQEDNQGIPSKKFYGIYKVEEVHCVAFSQFKEIVTEGLDLLDDLKNVVIFNFRDWTSVGYGDGMLEELLNLGYEIISVTSYHKKNSYDDPVGHVYLSYTLKIKGFPE